jgi:nitrogen regulatory protein PII
VSTAPGVEVEIRFVEQDDDVGQAIQVILSTARTGHAGDGDICVVPVEHRYDIATGRRETSQD